MNYLLNCFSYTSCVLQQLGLFEPEIPIKEAKGCLDVESQFWQQNVQDDQDDDVYEILEYAPKIHTPNLLARAINQLSHYNIKKPLIAVDLEPSCATFNLLLGGWTVLCCN